MFTSPFSELESLFVPHKSPIYAIFFFGIFRIVRVENKSRRVRFSPLLSLTLFLRQAYSHSHILSKQNSPPTLSEFFFFPCFTLARPYNAIAVSLLKCPRISFFPPLDLSLSLHRHHYPSFGEPAQLRSFGLKWEVEDTNRSCPKVWPMFTREFYIISTPTQPRCLFLSHVGRQKCFSLWIMTRSARL